MSARDRLQAFCVGCMAGTACTWTVFSTLILALPDSHTMFRLWIALVSTVLGGTIAGSIPGSIRSLASLVISCCMTVQLYDPAFGPSAIPLTTKLYTSTALALFIAACFGHTLPLTGLNRRGVGRTATGNDLQ